MGAPNHQQYQILLSCAFSTTARSPCLAHKISFLYNFLKEESFFSPPFPIFIWCVCVWCACKFACVGMSVWEQMQAGVYVCMLRPRLKLGITLNGSSTFFDEAGFLNQTQSSQSGQSHQSARSVDSLSLPHKAGYWAGHHPHSVHSFWESDQSPHSCMVSDHQDIFPGPQRSILTAKFTNLSTVCFLTG